MKKYSLLLILLSLCILTVEAQWQKVNGPCISYVNTIITHNSVIFIGTTTGVYKSTDNGNTWTIAGLIHETRKLLSNGNNIYAATANGIYLSTNNGNSWTAINNGLSSTNTYTITENGGTLFAGIYHAGVFKSTNNGTSWSAANSGLPAVTATSIVINGNAIFATLSTMGIYLSTDDGASWSAVNTGLPSLTILSLAKNGNNIYAGPNGGGIYIFDNNQNLWTLLGNNIDPSAQSIAFSGDTIYAGVTDSILYSQNNGSTWNTLKNGFSKCGEINDIMINGTDIFAGTFRGVYLSTNNGSFWNPINKGLLSPSVYNVISKGNKVFAGTKNGIFISNDYGNTFLPALSPPAMYVKSFLVLGDTILACKSGGILISADNGDTWSNHSTFQDVIFSDIAINGNKIFATSDDITNTGVFSSTDYGVTWSETSFNSNNCYALITIADTILVATGNGVAKSFDNGLTWNNSGNTSYYAIERTENGIIYTGNGPGIIVSYDNGHTFTYLLPSQITCPLTNLYSLFTINNTVFAGMHGCLYLSNNNANTFTSFSSGLPDNIVSSIAVSGGNAIAGISTTGSSTQIGIYKRDLSGYIPCSASFNIYPDPSTPHNWFVLNNSFGLEPVTYEWSWGDGSTSSGPYPSHTYANSGYYNICLTITDTTGCSDSYCDNSTYIYKTENDMITVNVVDELPISSTGINEKNKYTLNVYPNPSSSILTIERQQLTNCKLTATLYDVTGKLLQTQTSDQTKFTMDISGLSKGIYILSVFDGERVVNRKVVKE